MLLLLLACTLEDTGTDRTGQPGDDTGAADTGDTADTGDSGDTGEPQSDGCRADPGDADRDRAVVVSFPYNKQGRAASAWEVLSLQASTGTLSQSGVTFEMGRGYSGVVAFSPDGSLGIAPQDDGSVGIFTLDDKLVPTVVEAEWAGGAEDFYVSGAVFDPSGERAWLIDGNWENNGGGLYEVVFDCETGAPTLVGRTIASKLAAALFPMGDTAVLVAAGAAGEEGGDAWLLSGWPDAPVVAGKTTLFDYEDAILASAAIVGETLLVGDNSSFSGTDNRVAAALVGADSLQASATTTELLDPFAIVASPFGDAALVSSGFGDDLYVLSVADGEVTASTKLSASGVALPGSSVVIERGALEGTALVIENVAIRTVRFDGAGGASDEGVLAFGDEYTDIPGAIGVQP
ncbi:hypothetical protein LBMAG42_41810 [Deltaproteobacteria bacterium]|nr:hypothetical protein LBMAG42_41810 [Deltaproteobacteria bacterium]